MDHFVFLQSGRIVAALSVTAGNHQMPFDLVGSARVQTRPSALVVKEHHREDYGCLPSKSCLLEILHGLLRILGVDVVGAEPLDRLQVGWIISISLRKERWILRTLSSALSKKEIQKTAYVLVVLELLRALALFVEYVSDSFEQLTVLGMGAQRLHVPVLGLVKVRLLLKRFGNLAVDLSVATLHGVELVVAVQCVVMHAYLAVGEAKVVKCLDTGSINFERFFIEMLCLLIIPVAEEAVAFVGQRFKFKQQRINQCSPTSLQV